MKTFLWIDRVASYIAVALTVFGYYQIAAWIFTGFIFAAMLLGFLVGFEFCKQAQHDATDDKIEKLRRFVKKIE